MGRLLEINKKNDVAEINLSWSLLSLIYMGTGPCPTPGDKQQEITSMKYFWENYFSIKEILSSISKDTYVNPLKKMCAEIDLQGTEILFSDLALWLLYSTKFLQFSFSQ